MALVRMKDRQNSRIAARTIKRIGRRVPTEATDTPPPPADLSYVNPTALHEILSPADVRVVTFHNEKAMMRYRYNLYAVNKQGEFRYRSMRDETSMWGLVIWRMK